MWVSRFRLWMVAEAALRVARVAMHDIGRVFVTVCVCASVGIGRAFGVLPQMLLYAIVFVTGLAGMLHAPWWAAVVGGCALALKLFLDDREVPFGYGDSATWDLAQSMSNVIIAVVAAPSMFAIGRVIAGVTGL